MGVAYKIHRPLFIWPSGPAWTRRGWLGRFTRLRVRTKGFPSGKSFLSACSSAPVLLGALTHAGAENRNAADLLPVPAPASVKEDHGPQMVAVRLNSD